MRLNRGVEQISLAAAFCTHCSLLIWVAGKPFLWYQNSIADDEVRFCGPPCRKPHWDLEEQEVSRAGGSYSLVFHSGLLGAQSRYYDIYNMQTGVEDTGQHPSCGCTSGQIQRVLSTLIQIEDYSQVEGF